MEITKAIILGIVQGVTEWLPISSSGHLAILQNFFTMDEGIFLDSFLHLGSLLALLFVFHKDIVLFIKKRDFKLIFYAILASIPIAVVGFLFLDLFKMVFSNLYVISGMFILNGGILLLSKRITRGSLNAKNSFLIGLAQVLALFPGISRSGVTITAGVIGGVKARSAAKFSFLIGAIAIVGASILSFSVGEFDIVTVMVGMLASSISAYFSVRFLMKMVENGTLFKFSYYCFLMGMLVLLITIF